MCWACLTQTKEPQPVPEENIKSGLCTFHAQHGYKAVIQPAPDTFLVFGRIGRSGELDVRDDVMNRPAVRAKEVDIVLVPLPEAERPQLEFPAEYIPRPRAPRKKPKGQPRPKGSLLARSQTDPDKMEYIPIPRLVELCAALAAKRYSMRQVAARLNITYASTAYLLRLSALLPEVLILTTPQPGYKKRLDILTAVQLSKLHPELQLETALKVLEGKLSISALKQFASRVENGAKRQISPPGGIRS